MRFENGAALTLETSWMLNQLENETYGVDLFGDRGGAAWPALKWFGEQGGRCGTATIEDVDRDAYNGHLNEFKAFVEAVRAGGPSPIPAEQSLTVARILDGLYESAETGREVVVG